MQQQAAADIEFTSVISSMSSDEEDLSLPLSLLNVTSDEEFKYQIFNAARVGRHAVFKQVPGRKCDRDRFQRILQECCADDEGQSCPPLVIAARNGHVNVVKSLIQEVSRT